MLIGRMGLQTRIFDWSTHREVVKDLITISGQPEGLVREVVEEATDAGAADAARFRFEIQHLADDTGLPIQAAVEPPTGLLDRGVRVGDVRVGYNSVGGDFLTAACVQRGFTGIRLSEQEERQRVRPSR